MEEEWSITEIMKEDWTKAEGVKFTGIETNSALTERDYDRKCDIQHKICIVKGYWIWWCSAHHQPERWCEIGRLRKLIDDNCLVMVNKNLPTLLSQSFEESLIADKREPKALQIGKDT